jgi:hypothetical protein
MISATFVWIYQLVRNEVRKEANPTNGKGGQDLDADRYPGTFCDGTGGI